MTHVAGKGELQMAKRAAGWRSESFRTMAVERLRACIHIGRLCEELGVSRSQLGRWQKEFESRHAAEPASNHLEQENRRLKGALAEKVLEVDFLQGALQHIEARRRQNTARGARASTPRSGA
jgi:transposase-like protein